MIIEMLRWWYTDGWAKTFSRIKTRTTGVSRSFSITILTKTIFSPWKRIQYSGKSFDAKLHAMIDNLVSRIVGFFVRLAVLLAAGVLTILTLIVSIAIAVIWPLVPILSIVLLIKGVF